jgi:hypothetical protein
MAASTTITTSNFNNKLESWLKSASTMRQGAQDIIVFGMEIYAEKGDTGYLTRLYQAACQVKGLNAKLMADYIRAYANVQLAKADDGQWVFKKAAKGAAVVKPLDVVWWEYGKAKREANTKVLVFNRIVAVANAIESAIEDPATVVELADVDAALSKLQAVIAKAKRARLTVVEKAA